MEELWLLSMHQKHRIKYGGIISHGVLTVTRFWEPVDLYGCGMYVVLMWGGKNPERRRRRVMLPERRIKKKSHFPIMSFSQNIELSSMNGWGASRVWGRPAAHLPEWKSLLSDAGRGRWKGRGRWRGCRASVPSPIAFSPCGPPSLCPCELEFKHRTYSCSHTHPHTTQVGVRTHTETHTQSNVHVEIKLDVCLNIFLIL